MVKLQVILISGHAGSGKDVASQVMEQCLRAHGEAVLVTHFADLLKYICKSYLGWDGEKDAKGRYMLQCVGTELIRRQCEDYWVKFILDMLAFFENRWSYVVIPDTRFPNEVDIMKEEFPGTIHVRIKREFESALLEPQQRHASETALDGCSPDEVIENNGTRQEFEEKVREFVTKRCLTTRWEVECDE